MARDLVQKHKAARNPESARVSTHRSGQSRFSGRGGTSKEVEEEQRCVAGSQA